jgi:hypothetical protein
MSDYFHPVTEPVARKAHQCAGCLTTIPIGEKHLHSTGFYDGSAFRNRFHRECWEALAEEGEFEFIPGECEPPERLKSPLNAALTGRAPKE